MSSDISRSFRDRQDPYTGVVSQQGRVILDRDFNAQQDIVSGEIEEATLDIVGPFGTPDDGFAISTPEASPPGPPLWSPPAPQELTHATVPDFLIKPGTMYVGGQRVCWPARQQDVGITYSYFDQPDWVSPTVGYGLHEAVYLHLLELEVSATEDPDLLDVALGGIDTTQRLRLLRRVRRQSVEATGCIGAWASLVTSALAEGLVFDADNMQFLPQVKLKAGFTQTSTSTDPCDPIATGGFLGPDNQVIRVQIAPPVGTATIPTELLWGWDNASFMYRVVQPLSSNTMLQLTRDPPDAYHLPQTGQVVEILRTAAIIESEPDETDPTGRSTIVRCIAEPTGFVTTLSQPYGPPAGGGSVNYLSLTDGLPPAYANDTNPLFVRVWQARLPFTAGRPVELTDPSSNTTTGVEVTLSLPKGGRATAGCYWSLAVRPSTPQGIYPERLLQTPQSPDGPRQWACPLAVIDWRTAQGPVVADCRSKFESLVALTRRKPGCCTVSVGTDDLAGTTLQKIIDAAALLADEVQVCLGPGVFALAEPLRLTSAHNNMTIEACPGGATIEADAKAPLTAFSDGLITLNEANGVTLRGLTLTMPSASPATAFRTSVKPYLVNSTSGEALDSFLTSLVVMIGVHAFESPNLTIESCQFVFAQQLSPPATDVFGAALFLQGYCPGLTVEDSAFSSDFAPTFTTIQQPASAPAANATPQVQTAYKLLMAPDLHLLPLTVHTASPPADAPTLDMITTDITERVQSAFTTMDADFAVAGSLGLARSSIIATVGCLAAPMLAEGSSDVCTIGDATFTGNSFSGLTFAIAAEVTADTVRLQDNSIQSCVSGARIVLTGHQSSSNSLYGTVNDAIAAFREFLLIAVIASIYPPPAAASGAVPRILIRPRLIYTPTTLIVTDNQIEVLSGTQFCSSALVLLVNRPTSLLQDTTVSLVISGNRLRTGVTTGRQGDGRILTYVPTAFLTTPDLARCTLTGNLILSDPPPAGKTDLRWIGVSLLVMTDTNPGLSEALAVTGNVLFGTTNLDTLVFPGTSPPQTWLPFNSVRT